ISSAANARWSAAVALDTANAASAPAASANSCSNACTFGPADSHRLRMTSTTACSSSASYDKSLSGTRLSQNVNGILRLAVEVLRSSVVVRAPNIEPEAVRPVGTDTLAALEQSEHERWKVEVGSSLDMFKDARLVDVHAHAHLVGRLRLLVIAAYHPVVSD